MMNNWVFEWTFKKGKDQKGYIIVVGVGLFDSLYYFDLI